MKILLFPNQPVVNPTQDLNSRGRTGKLASQSRENQELAENFSRLLYRNPSDDHHPEDPLACLSPMAQRCIGGMPPLGLKKAFNLLCAQGSSTYCDDYRRLTLAPSHQELECRILQGPLNGLRLTAALQGQQFCLTLRTDNRKLYERLIKAKERLIGHLNQLSNPCHLEILHVVKKL